jgi:hypothetical protein
MVHSLGLLYRTALLLFLWAGAYFLCSAQQTGSLTGEVQDPTGVPISGAYNSLILDADTGEDHRTLSLDGSGRFRVSNLQNGKYKLTIRVLGFDTAYLRIAVSGEQQTLPPIRLGIGASGCFAADTNPAQTRFFASSPEIGALGGAVSSDETPVRGARVTVACWINSACGDKHTQTDSDGHFEFNDLPIGRYRLTIEKDGYSPVLDRAFAVSGGIESFYSFNIARPKSYSSPDLHSDGPKITVCE